MVAQPRQIPIRPEPLDYAHIPAERWSPVPMMIASGIYGIALLVFCRFSVTKFQQIFMDFKVTLPWPTLIALQFSQIIWTDYGWVVFIPFMICWPLALIPFLPVPQQLESRQSIVRATRYLLVILFFLSALGLAAAYFLPMVALIQSVSGP